MEVGYREFRFIDTDCSLGLFVYGILGFVLVRKCQMVVQFWRCYVKKVVGCGEGEQEVLVYIRGKNEGIFLF